MVDLLSLLQQKGIISAQEATAVATEAANAGENVELALLRHGVSEKDILAVKGEYWKIPAKKLGEEQIPFEVLEHIPEESARHYRVVPINITDGVLEVGIVDPDNLAALDALNFISVKDHIPFKVFIISEGDYLKTLEGYKGLGGEVGKALTELESELGEESAEAQKEVRDLEQTSENAAATSKDAVLKVDAPVTKIVATLLKTAVDGRASDIHIEPTGEKVRVRFRVDGELHTSIVLPANILRALIARIKILSSLRLDEQRKPQDGRFSATISNRRVDFRVSTFPTRFGEKAVLRILDHTKGISSLEEIGFNEEQLAAVREAINKPYGLILITGPTGSGKSTTLRAMLSEVDRDSMNVLSLEDPVEYNIEGVAQSQVRPEIGYTFASGLRSVLRQDPDVIMVGEIRDKETAQLAVQAALTGHLVFSSLHTNNAPGAVPRLIDMGVDPYLIAPTLELVIAQRLVRRLCPGGGRAIPVAGSLKAMLDEEFKDLAPEFRKKIQIGDTVWGIESTSECPSGTRGRIAAVELFSIHNEIEQAILKGADENVMFELARKQGMLTMKEDAILKAFARMIPFEEVNTLGGAYVVDDEAPKTTEQKETVKETVSQEEIV